MILQIQPDVYSRSLEMICVCVRMFRCVIKIQQEKKK